MMAANHRERQLMQYLRGAGWVKASALPFNPKLIQVVLGKGWIEVRGVGSETYYRITEQGLAAKMAPVRIYN
jgi:hypothetical protein